MAIKHLAKKYCPQKVKTINALHRLALTHNSKRMSTKEFIQGIRSHTHGEGLPNSFIHFAEMRINQYENQYDMSAKSIPKFKNPALAPMPKRKTNNFGLQAVNMFFGAKPRKPTRRRK